MPPMYGSNLLIPWHLKPDFVFIYVLWWPTLQPSVASCPWTENKLTRKLCLQVDNGTLNNEFTLAIQLLLAYIDDDEYANHFLKIQPAAI